MKFFDFRTSNSNSNIRNNKNKKLLYFTDLLVLNIIKLGVKDKAIIAMTIHCFHGQLEFL